jgi:NAD(P)-dependent dehydrogenase (short-subunit alcohol dehydrogenase family)
VIDRLLPAELGQPPPLRLSASPRIVNMSSSVGFLTRQTTLGVEAGLIAVAYAPSKTFLNAVTLQYATELAERNILINAGCPGFCAIQPRSPTRETPTSTGNPTANRIGPEHRQGLETRSPTSTPGHGPTASRTAPGLRKQSTQPELQPAPAGDGRPKCGRLNPSANAESATGGTYSLRVIRFGSS